MMQFKPFLAINRLIVTKKEKTVYDQCFHFGVNIIRGKNSSGKSTIADFIFYSLGGDLTKWKREALDCDYTYAEVNLSGSIFTLRREIRETSKAGMDIFPGTLEMSQSSRMENWLRYPYSATENKESFYQAIFHELGIPYAKSDNANSLTLHQLLRLMYVDQMTSLDRLFKFDRFDSSNKRKAIGELLIGLSSMELYQYRLRFQKLDSDLDSKIKEIQILHKFFGGQIKSAEEMDLEIESKLKEVAAFNIELEESQEDNKEDESLQELRKSINSFQQQHGKIKNSILSINFEMNDSERFVKSLESRLIALEDTSRTIDVLSNIGYKYCPACFEPVEVVDLTRCSLCGKSHSINSMNYDPTFKVRKEIEFQISESNLNLLNKQKQLEELEVKAQDIEVNLKIMKSSLDLLEKPLRSISQKTKEILIKIGRLNEEIRQVNSLKTRFSSLYVLYSVRDAVQKELNDIKAKIEGLESDLEKRMRSKKKLISDLTKDIIHADTSHEGAFNNAEKIEFDFGEDKVTIDEQVIFSASSMVYLKNAFRLALLQASCIDNTFLYPRFLLMDNIEDKGMEPERSHIFQREIVRVSGSLNVTHQIIFTTSMIDPELNDSKLCVGSSYYENNKSLRI